MLEDAVKEQLAQIRAERSRLISQKSDWLRESISTNFKDFDWSGWSIESTDEEVYLTTSVLGKRIRLQTSSRPGSEVWHVLLDAGSRRVVEKVVIPKDSSSIVRAIAEAVEENDENDRTEAAGRDAVESLRNSLYTTPPESNKESDRA